MVRFSATQGLFHMAVRPLSQTGWIRVPQNPNQRPYYAALGGVIKRTWLRTFNKKRLADGHDTILHPTKGWKRP